jgi:hypothetical protein
MRGRGRWALWWRGADWVPYGRRCSLPRSRSLSRSRLLHIHDDFLEPLDIRRPHQHSSHHDHHHHHHLRMDILLHHHYYYHHLIARSSSPPRRSHGCHPPATPALPWHMKPEMMRWNCEPGGATRPHWGQPPITEQLGRGSTSQAATMRGGRYRQMIGPNARCPTCSNKLIDD